MAGITIIDATAQLALWIAASAAVAANQEYEIDTGNGRRRLKRVDATEIREMINYWQGQVLALTPASAGGRRRTRYFVPE